MLLITCPVCGVEGDETDFLCGGEAHVLRPASSNPDNVSDYAQYEYMHLRPNPKGWHREQWLCVRGCGKWFNAVRHTVSMDFAAFYKIGDEQPPLSEEPAVQDNTPSVTIQAETTETAEGAQ